MIETEQKIFFLDLPLELRLQVYKLLCIEDKIHITYHWGRDLTGCVYYPTRVSVEDTPGTSRRRSRGGLKSYNLLRVNRQMTSEAAGVVYGCNDFEFDSFTGLSSFLYGIGGNRSHLRHISFTSRLRSSNKNVLSRRVFKKLEAATHLRSMKLPQGSVGSFDLPARSITLENMKRLLVAMTPMLKSLHEASAPAENNTNVLDLVHFYPDAPRCRHCLQANAWMHGRSPTCGAEMGQGTCPAVAESCRMLDKTFRGMVEAMLEVTP